MMTRNVTKPKMT